MKKVGNADDDEEEEGIKEKESCVKLSVKLSVKLYCCSSSWLVDAPAVFKEDCGKALESEEGDGDNNSENDQGEKLRQYKKVE